MNRLQLLARPCHDCGGPIGRRHVHSRRCWACDERVNRIRQEAQRGIKRLICEGQMKPATECTCVDCGKQARDYDHRDYAKLFDVAPVCRSCNVLRGPAKSLGPLPTNFVRARNRVTGETRDEHVARVWARLSAPAVTAQEV